MRKENDVIYIDDNTTVAEIKELLGTEGYVVYDDNKTMAPQLTKCIITSIFVNWYNKDSQLFFMGIEKVRDVNRSQATCKFDSMRISFALTEEAAIRLFNEKLDRIKLDSNEKHNIW